MAARSSRYRLSVLDLSPIPSGSSAGDALRCSIALAAQVESLGYARYWVAEHHNTASLASSSPEILIGQIAAATKRIRVGAGGIMLPNHSPLKVAEWFRLLHALFPARIDLGIGRAPGTDPRAARALRRGASPLADDFEPQLAELLGYLADAAPSQAAFSGTITAIPAGVPSPDLWILGSSDFGAALAARLGLGFAFAHHINPIDAVAALRRYRDEFRPSRHRAEPESILALGAICAETDAEAEQLASSGKLAMLRFGQGIRHLPFPSVEEARAYPYDPDEQAILQAHRGRFVVGSPAVVGAGLREIAEAARVDEIMITTMVHDPAARSRSYALIADALRADAHSQLPTS